MAMFPGWGMRRMRARTRALALAQSFDAAGLGRRQAGWHRGSGDADAANRTGLVRLRELARDRRRNDGWARRALEIYGNHTVGWGIAAKADNAGDAINAQAQRLWDDWANDVRCDYDGRLTLAGLGKLVMATVAESGEALIALEPAESRDDMAIPLRLRVLEPDYLDETKEGRTEGGGVIVQGVEFDSRGRRVAYWMFDHHPGASGLGQRFGFQSRRIPADRLLHVYRVERPGQTRGYSWFAPVMTALQDLGEYNDARRVQAKVGACLVAFITELDGADTLLGEEKPELVESLEPGQVNTLSPGQDISLVSPPAVAGDQGEFNADQLRGIAAGLGITYEDLAGHYKGLPFSAARMSRQAHWNNVHAWRWEILIPMFLAPVWREAMKLAGALNGWRALPTAKWTPPPMPSLEPDKEGLAAQRMIRAGIQTLSGAVREQGFDPASHFQEYAEDLARLDDLGIVLDCDARRTSATGQAQEAGEPREDPDA